METSEYSYTFEQGGPVACGLTKLYVLGPIYIYMYPLTHTQIGGYKFINKNANATQIHKPGPKFWRSTRSMSRRLDELRARAQANHFLEGACMDHRRTSHQQPSSGATTKIGIPRKDS